MNPNNLAVDVVKRGGKRPTESFAADKLRRSLIAACLSGGAPKGMAEEASDRTVEAVIVWLSRKPEVTSSDLRRIACHHLQTHHPDAAYMYEHYHHTI